MSNKKNKYFSSLFNLEKKKQIDKEGYCVFEPTDDLFEWLGVDLNYLKDKVDLLLKEEGEFAGYEGREE